MKDVLITYDYYAGGSIMPGRSFESNTYRYGFNKGSEKDDEITGVTGSHITTFFREYDLRLLKTWSIDPQAGKMPWQSPYVSMDNNPIYYNDPFGDVVEHSSFKDKVNTTIGRITNKEFRKNFRELKASSETYVFNKVGKLSSGADGNFTTDGNKLFINYQTLKQPKHTGESRLSSLFHETKHGIQFEKGKFGFMQVGDGTANDFGQNFGEWKPINLDAFDELDAFDSQYSSARGGYYNATTKKIESTNAYIHNSFSGRELVQLNFMFRVTDSSNKSEDSPYRLLPTTKINNSFGVKQKNALFYAMPNR